MSLASTYAKVKIEKFCALIGDFSDEIAQKTPFSKKEWRFTESYFPSAMLEDLKKSLYDVDTWILLNNLEKEGFEVESDIETKCSPLDPKEAEFEGFYFLV